MPTRDGASSAGPGFRPGWAAGSADRGNTAAACLKHAPVFPRFAPPTLAYLGAHTPRPLATWLPRVRRFSHELQGSRSDTPIHTATAGRGDRRLRARGAGSPCQAGQPGGPLLRTGTADERDASSFHMLEGCAQPESPDLLYPRGSMNNSILQHDQILTLHAAIMSAGMSEMRSGLSTHIDPGFFASIRLAATPTEQVLNDLSAMNVAVSLADGSVPLETWLGNAIALAGGRNEAHTFSQMLEQVRTRTLTEVRYQAMQATAEANATVAQLRAVGASLAKISLSVLARAGIWGRFPWTDKLQLRDQLVSTLRELGLPQSEIDSAEGLLRGLVRYRLGWYIADAAKAAHRAGQSSSSESPEELAARCQNLFDFGAGKVPAAAELREQFADFQSPEIEELLNDLEHFEATSEVRRPSVLDKE